MKEDEVIVVEWDITANVTTTTSTVKAAKIATISMAATTITIMAAVAAMTSGAKATASAATISSMSVSVEITVVAAGITVGATKEAIDVDSATDTIVEGLREVTTMAAVLTTEHAPAPAHLTNQAKTQATISRWRVRITLSESDAAAKTMVRHRVVLTTEVAIDETTTAVAAEEAQTTTATMARAITSHSSSQAASRCKTMRVLARAVTRVARTRWESKPRVGVATLGDVGSAAAAGTESDRISDYLSIYLTDCLSGMREGGS